MNRNSLRTLPVLAAVVVLASQSVASANSIVLRTEYPTEGESIELFVQDESGMPVSAAEVTVIYRPGSSVERDAVIGTAGADGRINWVPELAGIAAVTASWQDAAGAEVTATTNVSVRFGSTPWAGIFIMVFAGLLLVGGSVVRLLRVARSGG